VKSQTIAHLSDLHLGLAPAVTAKAEALVTTLIDCAVDHVVVTGDLTDAGRSASYRTFERVFAPLISQGRVTIVPGNHDRLGDDVGGSFMGGKRVDTVQVDGAYFVRVDSTGPHNRSSILAAHGRICDRVLDDLSRALDQAPRDSVCAILLHHHPVPLPAEGLWETISSTLGLPWAAELTLGEELLRRALGRCDLVLHGHRHVPSAAVLDPSGSRPLRVYNAGSSVERGGMNVFSHLGGALLGEPGWLHADAPGRDRLVTPPPARAEEYRLSAMRAA
jgi:3',5'-cyclic-AMP phosphodiesterase